MELSPSTNLSSPPRPSSPRGANGASRVERFDYRDVLIAQGDPLLVSVISLAMAVDRVGGVPWALVLGDESLGKLDGPAHGFERVVKVPALTGSTASLALVVHAPSLDWATEAALVCAMPAIFHDGSCGVGGAIIIDPPFSQEVAAAPLAILAGLTRALQTTLELYYQPETFHDAVLREQFGETSVELRAELANKFARIRARGWFRR